jgi:hypothetical protein
VAKAVASVREGQFDPNTGRLSMIERIVDRQLGNLLANVLDGVTQVCRLQTMDLNLYAHVTIELAQPFNTA